MSIMPPRNSLLSANYGFDCQMPIITNQSFEKIDFHRPEKYIKEIAYFLDGINILPAPDITKSMRKG